MCFLVNLKLTSDGMKWCRALTKTLEQQNTKEIGNRTVKRGYIIQLESPKVVLLLKITIYACRIENHHCIV